MGAGNCSHPALLLSCSGRAARARAQLGLQEMVDHACQLAPELARLYGLLGRPGQALLPLDVQGFLLVRGQGFRLGGAAADGFRLGLCLGVPPPCSPSRDSSGGGRSIRPSSRKLPSLPRL